MAYWNQTELNAALSADVPATKSTIISVMQAAGLYPSGAERVVGEEITKGGLKGDPAAPGLPTSIVIDTNTRAFTSEIAVKQAGPIVVATATGKDRVHIQSSDATVVSGSTSANEQRFYFEGSATNGTFYAGAGNDIVYGGDYRSGAGLHVPLTVVAGTGTSEIYADGDIHASAGGSRIVVGQTATSHSTVTGGAGDDSILLFNGFNTVMGGGGEDVVDVRGGANFISFDGSSNDVVILRGGENHVTIGAGDQAFVGTGPSANTIDASAGGAIRLNGGQTSVMQGATGEVKLFGGAVTVGAGYVYLNGLNSSLDTIASSNARSYFGTSHDDVLFNSSGASIVYTEAADGDHTFNLSGTDSIFVGAGGGVDTVTLTGNGGHGDLVKATDHTAAQIAGTSVDGAGYTTITFSNSGQTLVVKGVDITYSDGTKIAY